MACSSNMLGISALHFCAMIIMFAWRVCVFLQLTGISTMREVTRLASRVEKGGEEENKPMSNAPYI